MNRTRTTNLTVQTLRAMSDDTTLNANRLDALTALVRGLELRISDLETATDNFDHEHFHPETMAEAKLTIAALQQKLLDSLIIGLTKQGYLATFEAEKERIMSEALPVITDRVSLSLYIAAVTERMRCRFITPAECRTLLYAAQVAISGKDRTMPVAVSIMQAMGDA